MAQDATLSFSGHARETLRLGLPIALSRSGLIGLFAVDTVTVGQRGGLELAALGVGTAPMSTLMLVCLGGLQATMVLSAQAMGEGRPSDVGAIFRAACVNALALGVLAGLASLYAEPFFLMTGQAPAVAALAGQVAFQFALGLPLFLLFLAANLTLETIGRPRLGVAIMAGANVANILFDGIFVLGWGGFFEPGGAEAAVATTSVVRAGMAVAALMLLFSVGTRGGDPYGFRAPPGVWLRAAAGLGGEPGRQLRRLGLPMGLGQGVESAAFSAMVLIAGAMSAEVVAAHQATMTMMSLIYMNAVGLGAAASIRVGAAKGRGTWADLRRAGFSAIWTAGAVSGCCGPVLLAVHVPLAGLMIDEPTAAAVARDTLFIAAFLVAFDTMMGTAIGGAARDRRRLDAALDAVGCLLVRVGSGGASGRRSPRLWRRGTVLRHRRRHLHVLRAARPALRPGVAGTDFAAEFLIFLHYCPDSAQLCYKGPAINQPDNTSSALTQSFGPRHGPHEANERVDKCTSNKMTFVQFATPTLDPSLAINANQVSVSLH